MEGSMSHFTVLVIGDDPEAQLAPFHEFECTGVDDQYVQDIDKTEEVQARIVSHGFEDALDYYGLGNKCFVDDESKVDKTGPHKYRHAIVRDGKLIKAVERTNPNKKWDWYVLGGRWEGFFLKKTGERTEQCLHSEVDFKAMRERAGNEARREYESAREALGDVAEPKPWQSILEEHANDVNRARVAFNAQPAYERARKHDSLIWASSSGSLHEYYMPLEHYMERARRRAITPFALVRDGKWFERGSMGWWGVVSAEKDQSEWEREVDSLLEGLPPTTLLSLYDCHI